MMFWWGLLLGGVLGMMFGIMLIAMCQSAADADRRMGYKE